MRSLIPAALFLKSALAAGGDGGGCPFLGGELRSRQAAGTPQGNQQFISQFVVEDTNTYMTSDWGAGIDEAISKKAGIRGPTALEDVILRQKLQHFDHERIRFCFSTPTFTLFVWLLSTDREV
ncbi:catalase [Ilyonectria robusta]